MECGFSLEELLRVTWGRLVNLSEEERIFITPSQICTDTRTIRKGDFFLALKGKNFDGNDFILEAYKKGARGAIAHNAVVPLSNNFFIVQVRDTLIALQKLAKCYRHKLSIPLVAVTGSNGKTTVKDLIAHILSTRYVTSKSSGNFNNQIGVPLSLLSIASHHQVGVLELGTNQPGEIKVLSRMVQPTIGVITNIHSSHLGPMGTVEGIAREKAEMIPFLNHHKENVLIIKEDSSWTPFFRKKATCKIVTFSQHKKADFTARNIKDEGERITFDMCALDGERVTIGFPFPGLFNVCNVLAASVVCSILGMSLSEIKKRVARFTPPPLRYHIERRGRYNILNDCYNANPESMKLALYTLKQLRGGRKIAILGDMLELGEHSAPLHQSVGEFAASCGIDALFACGRFADDVTTGAQKGGIKDCFSFDDKKVLLRSLLPYINGGDWLLIKGSRGTRMEELIDMLDRHLQ